MPRSRSGSGGGKLSFAPIARRSLRSVVPSGARRRLSGALGLDDLRARVDALEARLEGRIERLETALHESRDEAWERSRRRWRGSAPDPDLTWGAEITGDAFVEKASEHGVFGAGRTILEVGPGYGRLLDSALDRKVEFGRWIGIDLSPENVAHLRDRFPRDEVRFEVADVEEVRIEGPVDAVISSLTFKHLFPSFEAALRNLARQMREGGRVAFDLIEGQRRYFEEDGVTYIRHYSRPEIEEIIRAAGLEPVAFDEVLHHPEMSRLLVVARKPG